MFDMTSEVGSPVVHAENALTSGGVDNLCKIIAKKDFALTAFGVSAQ